LTEVTIPSSVTNIGNGAFSDCKNITDITIPNGVTSIGNGAFTNCMSLTQIVIPKSVTNIGESTFEECIALTNITIPNSVTSIGKNTFANCAELTKVIIPNGVTSIGDSAFAYCTALTNVTIPDTVTCIGDCVFQNCTGLTNLTIPKTVTSFGRDVFQNCTGLINLTIPNSVTSISGFEFGSYTKLTDITIPSSVTKIENSAFASCSNLVNIHIDSENKDYCSVDGVLFDKSKHVLLCYPSGRTQTSYVIPNSVSLIESDAFNVSNSKVIDITIPRSVTQIGAFAFNGTNITIRGYKNTSIQAYAKRNNFMFQSLDADSTTSDVSPLTSAAPVKNPEKDTAKLSLLFFTGVFICSIISIVCVILWNKKRTEGTKLAQTSPLQNPLSRAEIDANSGTSLEAAAEPEIMEVICLQCGHSCAASTEICPTCGRKFTK